MKEVLPWVALLRKCRGVQTELLKDFVGSYINLLLKLRLTDDALMNEMYMAMSYLLLERLGEEASMEKELQLSTPVYFGQERKDTMKMEYDCYDFDIEKAFGLSYVFVSSDWERFLYSFTDDYEKYPPRIAPNPHLARLGLYYFDKDVAVLVTPAGIYSYVAASLSLRGAAYRPLSKYFEMWGEGEEE